MKFKPILLVLASFVLTSCDLFSFMESKPSNEAFSNERKENSSGGENTTENPENNENSQENPTNNENTGENTGNNENTGENQGNNEENHGDLRVESISFSEKYLDLGLSSHKYEYVAVNFSLFDENLTTDDLTDEEKAGTFASLDSSIATVSEYGKISAVKEGKTVVTYTTIIGHLVAAITVYVHQSLDSITREYIKVNDVNSIAVGDELIFACPDFEVASSLTIYDGYVVPEKVTFSSDKSKIVSYNENVAQYYVGPSSLSEDALTFETQENTYLSGRNTDGGRKLRYSKNGKDQINWVVERPEGYEEDFIVSFDIVDDYWLMFNKISNSDIRFNLYDSNETTLMKKPTIYRKTIVRN